MKARSQESKRITLITQKGGMTMKLRPFGKPHQHNLTSDCDHHRQPNRSRVDKSDCLHGRY